MSHRTPEALLLHPHWTPGFAQKDRAGFLPPCEAVAHGKDCKGFAGTYLAPAMPCAHSILLDPHTGLRGEGGAD